MKGRRILQCLGTLPVLVVLASHRAHAAADATQLLADWSAAVQQHVPGTVDDTLRFVWRLSPAERSALAAGAPVLVKALSQAQNTQQAASRDRLVQLANALAKTTTAASFVDRAVMLHADAAMFNPHEGSAPDTPGRWVSTVVGSGGAHVVHQDQPAVFPTARDGQMTGRAGGDWNWPFARRLLAATPIVPGNIFVSKWYHATTAYLFINAYYGEADAHLGDAAVAFPEDPKILFDRGCIAETLAGNLFQFAAIDDRALRAFNQPSAHKDPVRRSVELPSTEELNARAEDLFRRALGADPQLFEAQVRLSRLLDIDGRHAEALEHAGVALNMRPPSDVAFYAHLFAALDLPQASGVSTTHRAMSTPRWRSSPRRSPPCSPRVTSRCSTLIHRWPSACSRGCAIWCPRIGRRSRTRGFCTPTATAALWRHSFRTSGERRPR